MRTLKYKNPDGSITETVNAREFIKNDLKGNEIYCGDTVIDYLGDHYIIVWDDFTCSYRLKSSQIYGGTKAITGSLTLANPDHVFIEPESTNERSRTPTSDSHSKKAMNTALKSMGIHNK